MVLVAVVALLLQDSPLKPLTEIGKRLDEGAAAFMNGTPGDKAWAPWLIFGDDAALRETLKKEGVDKLTSIGISLELSFRKGDASYNLRTFVHVSAGEARFLAFDGREGRKLIGAHPFDRLKGDTAPFAEAGRALAKVVQTGKAEGLPFLDPEKVKALIPAEPVLKQVLETLERSKKRAAEVCGKIAAFGAETVEVRFEDLSFGAGDKGMVRSKFNLLDDGHVQFFPGEFGAYPK
jgi:hypothetical protein